jgi:hypothetical protein
MTSSGGFVKKLVTWLLSVGIIVTAIAAPPVRAVDTTPPDASWSEETLVTDTLSDLEWTLAFDELIAPGQVTSGEISNDGTAPGCSFTIGRRTTYLSGQTTFRVTVSGCSADGTIIPRLAQNSVKDAANNDGPVADVPASESATYDTTAPVVTSVSVDELADTTADLNFTSDESGTYYYLVYAEPDSAPVAATIKAQGTAVAKGSAAATAATAVDVTMTGLTASTTYTVYLIVEDAAGNQSSPSDTDFTTTATPDTTQPILSAFSVDTLTTTSADLNFTSDESGNYYYLVYAEEDDAPDAATIKAQGTAVNKGAAATTAATAEDVTMSGLTASTTYTVYLVVEDAAGNASVVYTDFTTATPDTTAPTASWSAESSGDQNSLAGLSWTLTFSEAVTGLIGGDIENAATFTSTGCAFSVATADAGAGLVYTVSVASCGSGTIRPSLKASSVDDAASNSGPTAAADGSTTVTYDATAPTATWSAESSGAQTSLAGLSWTLTFSEAVTGLAAGDIENAATFTSTGCAFSVATADAGAGLVYTVSVASCSEGTIRPSLKASSVVDAASNSGPTAAADGSTTVTYDVVAGAPTATWSAESSGAQTSLAGLSWTLTFSEAVTGLIGGDIDNAATFTSTGCAFSVATADAGAGLIYTVSVASCGGGTIRPRLNASSVADAAGISGPAAATNGTTTVTYTAIDVPGYGPTPRTGAGIRGGNTVRNTLTVNAGAWTGGARFAYQWYRCTSTNRQYRGGESLSGCTAISGATGTRYRLANADRGFYHTVRISGTNGTGTNRLWTSSTTSTAR